MTSQPTVLEKESRAIQTSAGAASSGGRPAGVNTRDFKPKNHSRNMSINIPPINYNNSVVLDIEWQGNSLSRWSFPLHDGSYICHPLFSCSFGHPCNRVSSQPVYSVHSICSVGCLATNLCSLECPHSTIGFIFILSHSNNLTTFPFNWVLLVLSVFYAIWSKIEISSIVLSEVWHNVNSNE